MEELKIKRTRETVPNFLTKIESDSVQLDGFELDRIIREETGLNPVIWGKMTIGYGSYIDEYHSKKTKGEYPLIAFRPEKSYLSLYIMTGFHDYRKLIGKIGPIKHTDECLHITNLADLDETLLRELIRSSVASMREIHENTSD